MTRAARRRLARSRRGLGVVSEPSCAPLLPLNEGLTLLSPASAYAGGFLEGLLQRFSAATKASLAATDGAVKV